MEAQRYYLVRFRTTCEECGHSFQGIFYRKVPENDTSPLSSVLPSQLNAAAESIDAKNTRKWLDTRLREHRWSEVSGGGAFTGVSYYMPFGHSCPHCGARQSWDPMQEPKKPEKKSGRLGYTAIGAVFCGICGMLVGLFAMAITLEHIALTICSVAGIVIGLLFGYWVGGLINKDELESYSERLAAYERDKEAYEKFQKSLATRTVHNEPEPDLDSGCFGPTVPFASDLDKYQPGHCPSCGKNVEGKVIVGSVNEARARRGCCPWCGEKLPAYLQVRVGSK